MCVIYYVAVIVYAALCIWPICLSVHLSCMGS